MRYTVSYHFPFFFQGLRGIVEVYPAGAYVTFGGVGAQIEAWRGPILEAIFKARLQYSSIRRDHSDDCFCLSCCCERVTSANPHGWPEPEGREV